jgi:hypothetical protein
MSTSKGPHGPVENRLLSALPAQDYERLLPYLQPVIFPLGKVVYESGGRLNSRVLPHDRARLLALHHGRWGSPVMTGW